MNDRITVTTLAGTTLTPLLSACSLEGNALVVEDWRYRFALSEHEADRVRLALGLADVAAGRTKPYEDIKADLVRNGVVRGKLDAIAKREMDEGTYDVMYVPEESE